MLHYDLDDESNAEIWQIMTSQGRNRLEARAIWQKIQDAEQKIKDIINHEYSPKEWHNLGNPVPQELIDEQDALEAEEENAEETDEEMSDEEWEAKRQEMLARKHRLKEAIYLERKMMLLNRIQKKLDDDDNESMFLKTIEDSGFVEPVRRFVTCMGAFAEPAYAQIGRIEVDLIRQGDKIEVKFRCFNIDGKETMFDDKGRIIEMHEVGESKEPPIHPPSKITVLKKGERLK